MPRSALFFSLFVLCYFSATATAQPPFGDPFAKAPIEREVTANKLPKGFDKLADVELTVTPNKAKWGETVTVKLTVTPKDGGTTYPFFPSPPQNSKNGLADPLPLGDLIFIGKVADPPGLKLKLDGTNEQYYDEPVTWEFKAVVSPRAKPGKKSVDLGETSVQVCKKFCITASGNELPSATFEVLEGASANVKPEDLASALKVLKIDAANTGNDKKGPVAPSPVSPSTFKSDTRKDAKPIEVYTSDLKSVAKAIVADDVSGGGGVPTQTGLWAFIATAALWGLISLVTPCVFPMIPITVSIFLKQAHGSFRERLKLAGVYSLTIITVLGLSAFALLKFMAALSVHPVTNLLLAAIFMVLALSLFGMYELTLPNSLQKRLQSKQSQGGVIGTIFGALAFTVISFTCVAPFLGGFAGISAGNEASGSLISMPTSREIAGGLAFATAFAAPFFILALLPGLMRALPKSGGWLDSVKVVMGFLEIAAALKFLRTAELGVLPTPQYFTYDVVLGGWVAISAACGLYLLNVFRLPHDEEKPNISVPRLFFALLFLGLAIYLAPALFKGHDGKPQRPGGVVYAWVESFLLPDTGESWSTDLKDTFAASRTSGRPIFMDFTGKTCTNCKYNEHNIFPQPAIRDELQQFEKIQLYTDWVPESAYRSDPGERARSAEARINRDFQTEVFKDIKLPLYAVLMPQADGKLKLIGTYEEGKINDPAQFAAFLKASLEKAKKK